MTAGSIFFVHTSRPVLRIFCPTLSFSMRSLANVLQQSIPAGEQSVSDRDAEPYPLLSTLTFPSWFQEPPQLFSRIYICYIPTSTRFVFNMCKIAN